MSEELWMTCKRDPKWAASEIERLRSSELAQKSETATIFATAALRTAEDLRKRAEEAEDQVIRWFKAASPYATPGSLKEALERYENAAPQAEQIGDVNGPRNEGLPADAALTCLCLSFPHACQVHRRDGSIDSTIKPSAWD